MSWGRAKGAKKLVSVLSLVTSTISHEHSAPPQVYSCAANFRQIYSKMHGIYSDNYTLFFNYKPDGTI
mgnify:CR=1 FL=1